MSKKALGRGLSALIDETSVANDVATNNDFVMLPVHALTAGKFQPRMFFNEDSLTQLATSIKEEGVLQPIIVRPIRGGDSYQIIAGERRWRASQLAGKTEIPAIIKTLDDKQALAYALIENIQRDNLSPIEEAEGYYRLQIEFNYSQSQLSQGLGKSRSHIANMLRLLTLPEDVKDFVNDGSLSMGHARALVNHKHASELANIFVKEGLSVREAEKYALKHGQTSHKKRNNAGKSNNVRQKNLAFSHNENISELEKMLSDTLGLTVNIIEAGEGGSVVIKYNSLSELDLILQKLG